MPSRRALVVGIDDYPGRELYGCINDAVAIANLLRKNSDGSPNFDVRLLASDTMKITRGFLRQEIEKLFRHDAAEVALLYFAGHGTENNLGGYIVTPDATRYDEGVALVDILTHANNSKAQERVIVLDSCMSGSLGQLPATASESANLAQGVSILTAARGNQSSVEVGGNGVFSSLVCSALEGGAADVAGHVHAAAVYSYVEQVLGPWDQRPLFKAHLSQMVPLRIADPAVPLGTLRMLPSWFPADGSIYPLNPSYEYTADSADESKVSVFKKLQQCRDAKLVEAVDETYLYWAAMNSTGCRLTRLGQHYRRLVKEGRL